MKSLVLEIINLAYTGVFLRVLNWITKGPTIKFQNAALKSKIAAIFTTNNTITKADYDKSNPDMVQFYEMETKLNKLVEDSHEKESLNYSENSLRKWITVHSQFNVLAHFLFSHKICTFTMVIQTCMFMQ